MRPTRFYQVWYLMLSSVTRAVTRHRQGVILVVGREDVGIDVYVLCPCDGWLA